MSIPTERELAAMRLAKQGRVRREGFEITSLYPEDGDTCHYGLHQKVRGRWCTAPCGNTVAAVLEFSGPAKPEGVRVPLCRECIARIAREMISQLTYIDPE